MLRKNIFKFLSHLIWIDTISHLSNFWKLLGIIFTHLQVIPAKEHNGWNTSNANVQDTKESLMYSRWSQMSGGENTGDGSDEATEPEGTGHV